MDDTTLFQAALNLQPPWTIKKISFSSESRQLDIWIIFFQVRNLTVPNVRIKDVKDMILMIRPGDI